MADSKSNMTGTIAVSSSTDVRAYTYDSTTTLTLPSVHISRPDCHPVFGITMDALEVLDEPYGPPEYSAAVAVRAADSEDPTRRLAAVLSSSLPVAKLITMQDDTDAFVRATVHALLRMLATS